MLATDAQEFDCADCPLMDAYEQLSEENRSAWGLFRRICSRFTSEFGVIPVLIEKAVADAPFDEAMELTERFSLIYDICHPPKPTKT